MEIMSLIDHPHEILNFSLPFPFYQQFNPLFNGIATPFIIWSKHFGARGPPGPAGPSPRAPKCFDQMINGVDIPLNNGLNC